MTLEAFQGVLARLATDPHLRERVRSRDRSFLVGDLTDLERRRLQSVAPSQGLHVVATLISSFRLGKILTLLPFTRVVLGEDRLVVEVKRFWKANPPRTNYFLEEAVAFCEYLLERASAGRRVTYLEEVVGYERAMLELRRVRGSGPGPEPQRVRFTHNPAILLSALAEGRKPRRVPPLACSFVGTAEDGDVRWRVERHAEVGAADGVG